MSDAHDAAVRDLEGAFALLFGRLRRLYADAATAVHPGMAPGTFKLFSAVARVAPVSLSALAEQTQSDKGLISRGVSELETLGLVERTADPADGRVRLIMVTPLGRERLAAVQAPHLDRLGEVLARWPLADVLRLTHLLEALANGDTPAAR